MDVKELFNGIAVIIDDEINNPNSSIRNILKQIEDNAMPCVKYDELPDSSVIKHLRNAAFVLLDWKLDADKEISNETFEGVKLPETINADNDEKNIRFLKDLQSKCFCPIFIFTNENVEAIKEKLRNNGLYRKGKCSIFLIKSKSDFTNEGSLFSELENWIKETAPIYLLKEWDNAYQCAKSNLFIDFQKRSPYWTKALWDTYIDDNVNPSLELSEFLMKSIQTQIQPLKLDAIIFEASSKLEDPRELAACLERQCYIDAAFLDSDIPGTGDIFDVNNNVYINIRPCCDLIPRDDTPQQNDINLYLIKGERIKKPSKIKEFYHSKYGLIDNESCFKVYPVCNGYLINFKFQDIFIKKWGEVKNTRKGRLLPPFLTKLQMKYGSYLQRQGLPKLPKESIIIDDVSTSTDNH